MDEPIRLVGSGFYVDGLRDALKNESVWNRHVDRTEPESSPHHGCDDIWVRYAANGRDPGPFECEWYPMADEIPVKGLVEQVRELVGGGEVMGVLITRIPPHQSVKPHVDSGWHAENTEKYGLCIAANDRQAFCFEKTSLVTRTGDLFWFDNSHKHWVTNDSDEARITCIICIKKENATCLGA